MRNSADSVTYYVTIARDTDYNGVVRCQSCGGVACDVHEIVPRSYLGSSNEELLFSVENRVCLCRECHGKLHNDAGRGFLLGVLYRKYNYSYGGIHLWLLEEFLTEA